ncbi:unnamed protein product [Microthlaspi erraticum]|uniref:NB-ARC domain-containing protein n=1 Tax=Microthlaspi erraticum TaxID=1685480 RepID=A0A6D2HR48_9BRAS|nr:unnamed protein product [Microthlaspi erraticum]
MVRQESPDMPGDRSRLWIKEEIIKMFIDDIGTSAVEGIFLDMSKLKFEANPKLSLLHWEHYPLDSLPQSFDPKNLVEINLPNSCVKQLWKGEKSLEKLKKLRLSFSYNLTELPRISSAPNLEYIDLEGCNSLVSISQSICRLKKLVFLNLKDCSNLKHIPSTLRLEVLNIAGCSKLH